MRAALLPASQGCELEARKERVHALQRLLQVVRRSRVAEAQVPCAGGAEGDADTSAESRPGEDVIDAEYEVKDDK